VQWYSKCRDALNQLKNLVSLAISTSAVVHSRKRQSVRVHPLSCITAASLCLAVNDEFPPRRQNRADQTQQRLQTPTLALLPQRKTAARGPGRGDCRAPPSLVSSLKHLCPFSAEKYTLLKRLVSLPVWCTGVSDRW
jgi:hypothetical protein